MKSKFLEYKVFVKSLGIEENKMFNHDGGAGAGRKRADD